MRTRLFHSIVVCGAALGVAVGCSGDGDEGDAKKRDAGCPPHVVPATDEMGGSSTLAPSDDGVAGSGDGTAGANDGAVDAGSTGGCGGWPPTK